MGSEKLSITPEIRGAAALRLFALGKREISESFLSPLYCDGIGHAMKKNDYNSVTRILSYTVATCTESPEHLPIIRQTFNSGKISSDLNASNAVGNLKLFKILGECLCLFPTKIALPFILTTWVKSKNEVSSFSKIKKSNRELETAWGPMLAALGACAASDDSYLNFDQDKELERELEPFYQRKNQLINERNPLIESYKEIYRHFEDIKNKTGQYPAGITLNDQVIKQHDLENFALQINLIDSNINNLEAQIQKIESSLSAGNALMKITGNSQRYHAYLRQYAVIGLMTLMKSPYLESQAKERISEYLQSMFQNTQEEKRFRTFEVRLTPDTSLGEALQLLRTGIGFLTQKSEKEEYNELPGILRKLAEEVPNLFDFFSKYPLRLVLPEDKFKFYGNYASSRYDLERWTRFQGELYIGEVEDRYFELDDLTRPNSMGISIFALQNMFVALPTLWHEYQHYGEKSVKTGNENEMSVYALENIFLRRLIMDHLKKMNPLEVKAELEKILFNIRTNDPGAYLLLTLDLYDKKSYDDLKNIIATNYPERQLPLDAAILKAETHIKKEDDQTIESNLMTFFWHPEIKWPLLIGSKSSLYNELNSILIKNFTQKNVLSFEEWEELLSEPKNSLTLRDWALFADQHQLDKYFEEHTAEYIGEEILRWLNRI